MPPLSTGVAGLHDPLGALGYTAQLLGGDTLGRPASGPAPLAGVDFFPAFSPIADYDTLSQDVSLSGGGVTEVRGFWIRPTGLQLFTGRANFLTEWALSPAWDLSSATFVQTVTLSALLGMQSITFSPDGTVLFAVTQATGIQSYVLSTAWDITTVGGANFFNSADGDGLQGVTVASDGSLTVTGNGDSTNWNETLMSTPFDLTSASIGDSESQAEAGSVNGIFMHGLGDKFYAIQLGADLLHEYDITGFDITTKVLNDSSIDLATPQSWTNVNQFMFRPDGSELFVAHASFVSTDLASYIL